LENHVLFKNMENTTELELWMSMERIGFSLYEVSTLGRLSNIPKNYILKGTVTNSGYLRFGLYADNGKQYSKLVHILVATMFLSNPENKSTVDHIDRNKLNNKLSNLRWATSYEQALNKEHSRKGIPAYLSTNRQTLMVISSRGGKRLEMLLKKLVFMIYLYQEFVEDCKNMLVDLSGDIAKILIQIHM